MAARRGLPQSSGISVAMQDALNRQRELAVLFIDQSTARGWHCAARREITRAKGGKLPQQRTRSPRRLVEIGTPRRSGQSGR